MKPVISSVQMQTVEGNDSENSKSRRTRSDS